VFKVLTFCSVGRPAAYGARPGLPVPTVGQAAQTADLYYRLMHPPPPPADVSICVGATVARFRCFLSKNESHIHENRVCDNKQEMQTEEADIRP
jgi:hypothetical protein